MQLLLIGNGFQKDRKLKTALRNKIHSKSNYRVKAPILIVNTYNY